MESTIIRKLKGSDMEYIFDNMSHIVNIKHYEGNNPHHYLYAPTKQYKYKITIRHAEGADAEQLFTDALNSLVKPKQGATTNKMVTKHTQGEWHVSKHGARIREQLPEYIKITYEVPQNMWGWTDTRFLQSISLYKSKKQCIEGANEYLNQLN